MVTPWCVRVCNGVRKEFAESGRGQVVGELSASSIWGIKEIFCCTRPQGSYGFIRLVVDMEKLSKGIKVAVAVCRSILGERLCWSSSAVMHEDV